MNRYQVSIGGNWLHKYLDSDARFKGRVFVNDIQYAEPQVKRTIETAGSMDGGIITKTYREKASVTIVFNVMVWDPAARYEAIEAIRTLASKGGTIITSNRPKRALYNCICETYPEVVSSKARTDELTMTFSSWGFPYWQDQTETVRALFSARTNANITIPGNAPIALPTVEIVAQNDFPSGGGFVYNKDGTVTMNTTPTITVGVGSTKIKMFYQLKRTNYCVIDTDANSNLRIRIYDNKTNMRLIASGLDYLLPDSSDRLEAVPGKSNNFSIDMGSTVSATLRVRGAWL